MLAFHAAAEFAFLVFLTLFLGVQDTLKHCDPFDARFVTACLLLAALWQCSSHFSHLRVLHKMKHKRATAKSFNASLQGL